MMKKSEQIPKENPNSAFTEKLTARRFQLAQMQRVEAQRIEEK